jgi:hypothetical protein
MLIATTEQPQLSQHQVFTIEAVRQFAMYLCPVPLETHHFAAYQGWLWFLGALLHRWSRLQAQNSTCKAEA